jgi:hypothetical protein
MRPVTRAETDGVPRLTRAKANHFEQFAHFVLVDEFESVGLVGQIRIFHRQMQASIQQKPTLAGVAQRVQSFILCRHGHTSEVDMRGDVFAPHLG